MNKLHLINFLLVIFVLGGCSKEELIPNLPIKSEIFHSEIVNEDYRLYIYLPKSYSSTSQDYKVVYQLDGDEQTQKTAALSEELIANNKMEEVIIVGIGYKNEIKRERDYTPTASAVNTNGGGASNFYRFLVEELIPKINSEYRTDVNNNTLKGHSLGGLFAIYALFQHGKSESESFKNFIIESGSLFYGDGIVFQYEQDFAKMNSDFPVKMFVSVGSLELPKMNTYFQAFESKIKSRNYSNLEYKFERLSGKTHLTTYDVPNSIEYIFN